MDKLSKKDVSDLITEIHNLKKQLSEKGVEIDIVYKDYSIDIISKIHRLLLTYSDIDSVKAINIGANICRELDITIPENLRKVVYKNSRSSF